MLESRIFRCEAFFIFLVHHQLILGRSLVHDGYTAPRCQGLLKGEIFNVDIGTKGLNKINQK